MLSVDRLRLQVTHFEDHVLWHPDTNTSNIFITNAQDYIISYCRNSSLLDGAAATGSINISHIHTGAPRRPLHHDGMPS